MKTDMFSFRNGIGLLLRALREVGLRDSLLELDQEFFVKLQNLGYVLLYG
jgi:hypothetical protein